MHTSDVVGGLSTWRGIIPNDCSNSRGTLFRFVALTVLVLFSCNRTEPPKRLLTPVEAGASKGAAWDGPSSVSLVTKKEKIVRGSTRDLPLAATLRTTFVVPME